MAQRNLITDVAGVLVGHAEDARLASGVSTIIFAEPAVAAVDVRGGAPATRETDLLEPHRTVERIDAVVLSGGSTFGLDASAGAQAADTFALGTAGAGFGATTVNLQGGLGSASAITRDGHTVGALVVVNACGSVNVGAGPHFWAAPFELDGEFGGLGFPARVPAAALTPIAKGRPGENTTIAIVATDAALTKAQAKELAVIAQDGLTRAIYPAHTTLDGDTVFAAATGRRPLADAVNELTELGAVAANTLARAIARGVFEAKSRPGGLPSWRDRYGR